MLKHEFIKPKKINLYIFTISIILIISSIITYAQSVKSDLSDNILRLHIIANSDSEYDQMLKIKVRDAIISQTSGLFSNSASIDETKATAKANLEFFEKIAKETLEAENCTDTVYAQSGNFNFPVKRYGNVILPSGNYDAIRIVIGEGKGQNWWCVMYPPLCLVDGAVEMTDKSEQYLKENLTEQEYRLITDNSTPEFEIKFKLLELFSK